jgi:hypothetical protein
VSLLNLRVHDRFSVCQDSSERKTSNGFAMAENIACPASHIKTAAIEIMALNMRLTRVVKELSNHLDACEQIIDSCEGMETKEPLKLVLEKSREALTNLRRKFSQQNSKLRTLRNQRVADLES